MMAPHRKQHQPPANWQTAITSTDPTTQTRVGIVRDLLAKAALRSTSPTALEGDVSGARAQPGAPDLTIADESGSKPDSAESP